MEQKKRPEPKDRVKEIRLEHKLTQNEFAESLCFGEFSVEPDTVSKIEQGKRQLSADVAVQISKKFQISLDWLYGLSGTRGGQADDAATILLNMREIFKLTPTDMTYQNIKHDIITYPYYKLSIEKRLDEFLLNITQADIYMHDKELPKAAYIPWVESIKEKYNVAIQNDEPIEVADYFMIPIHLHHKELIQQIMEAVCDDAISFMPPDK